VHQVGNASLASCHARSRLDPLPKRRLSCRRGGLCCTCLAPVPHSQIPSGRTKDQLNPRPNRRARVRGRRRPLLATVCPGAVLQRRFLHQIQIYQYHILDPFQQGVSSATPRRQSSSYNSPASFFACVGTETDTSNAFAYFLCTSNIQYRFELGPLSPFRIGSPLRSDTFEHLANIHSPMLLDTGFASQPTVRNA